MAQTQGSQSVALAVVALLAGMLLGVVGAHVFNITDETVTKSEEAPTSQTATADLRAKLNFYLAEHTYLVSEVMDRADTRPEALAPLRVALGVNAEELSAALTIVASGEEADEFGDTWTAYGESMIAYAEAGSDQDQEALLEAEEEIERTTQAIADQLAELSNDELDSEQTLAVLGQYNEDMLQTFDATVAANHEESYEVRMAARDQAGEWADEWAEALITAHQQEF